MDIKFSPPDITSNEIDGVNNVLLSGWITTGPRTKEFERRIAEYCGTKKAVCLNSATACLELTLRVLGIGAGDEVITSAYTYTASASVIDHVGAEIVLVDTVPNGYEMDYEKLAAAVTEKTKAIIAVDIAGIPCDYDRLCGIAESKRNIFRPNGEIQRAMGRIAVIADAAHSFGALRGGVRTGRLADFTCFSFHAVKNLTTAEGGAVTWKEFGFLDDEAIYREYMLWSLHGQNKDALAKTRIGAWEYDIERLGYKCNMTDIAAAVGLAQLERYSDILSRRRRIISIYDDMLKDCGVSVLSHYTDEYSSSGHLYLVRIDGADEAKRNSVIENMAKCGVATNVHYKPLPMHTAYKKLGFDIKDYPNSFAQYKNEVTLPLHTLLTDDEAVYVAEKFSMLVKGA